jgi:hypothetical protein
VGGLWSTGLARSVGVDHQGPLDLPQAKDACLDVNRSGRRLPQVPEFDAAGSAFANQSDSHRGSVSLAGGSLVFQQTCGSRPSSTYRRAPQDDSVEFSRNKPFHAAQNLCFGEPLLRTPWGVVLGLLMAIATARRRYCAGPHWPVGCHLCSIDVGWSCLSYQAAG